MENSHTTIELLDGATYHVPQEVADELEQTRNVALDAMDGEANPDILTDPNRTEDVTEGDADYYDEDYGDEEEEEEEDEPPPAKAAKKDMGGHFGRRRLNSREAVLQARVDFLESELERLDSEAGDPGAERADLICDASDLLDVDRSELSGMSNLDIKCVVLDSHNIQTDGKSQAYIDAAWDMCRERAFGGEDEPDEMSAALNRAQATHRHDMAMSGGLPSDLQGAFQPGFAKGLGSLRRRDDAWKGKYTDWMKDSDETQAEEKKKPM